MTKAIRSWQQTRRFRAAVRELKGLSVRELRTLWIVPSDINRLALEAARL